MIRMNPVYGIIFGCLMAGLGWKLRNTDTTLEWDYISLGGTCAIASLLFLGRKVR